MIGSFRLISSSWPRLACLALILDIPLVYVVFNMTVPAIFSRDETSASPATAV
jgi:hypothetical protein